MYERRSTHYGNDNDPGPIWKLWVDTQRRVVSFHEEAGSQLMEFRDREMFLRCIDGYTAQLYRYQ